MRKAFLALYVMEETPHIATGCNFIEMTPHQYHVSKQRSLKETHDDDDAIMMTERNGAFPSNSTEICCPICYDEYDNDDLPHHQIIRTAKQRQRVAECGHAVCHECLVQHCKVAILSKQIPIPCPSCACGHCLSSELVRNLLMIKYSKQTKETQDEDAWQVPITVSKKDLNHNNTTMENGKENTILDDNKNNTNNNNNNSKEKEDAIGHEVQSGWEKHSTSSVQLARTFSTETGSSFASMSSSVSSSSSCSSSPDYWNKYMRNQRLKEDPTLLVCPRCDELVVCPLDNKGVNKPEIVDAFDERNITCAKKFVTLKEHAPSTISKQKVELTYPEVECPSCHHNFCCIHGDIHSGESCAHFCKSQRARDMEQSELILNSISKHCSNGCGARIIRESGCDHVICTNCNHDMCYKCGTHEFLTGKVIRSCSKCRQGFVDHRYYARYRLRLLLILPFHLLLSAIYMAIVLVVAVLTCCFGCFFQCGTRGWTWELEQDETEPSSSETNVRINPARGISMTARALCMPMLELMVECGFIHGDDDH